MKKTYYVEVQEVNYYTIEVEAKNEEQAESLAKKAFHTFNVVDDNPHKNYIEVIRVMEE